MSSNRSKFPPPEYARSRQEFAQLEHEGRQEFYPKLRTQFEELQRYLLTVPNGASVLASLSEAFRSYATTKPNPEPEELSYAYFTVTQALMGVVNGMATLEHGPEFDRVLKQACQLIAEAECWRE